MKNSMFFSGLIGLLFMSIAFVNADPVSDVVEAPETVLSATCNGFLTVSVSGGGNSAFSPPSSWAVEINQAGVGSMQITEAGLNDFEVTSGVPFNICAGAQNPDKDLTITVVYDFCDAQGTLTFVIPAGTSGFSCEVLLANECN